MSEGAEKSVEELLAEAAAATEAHNPPKAKKERKPKESVGDDGVAKEPRAKREPKPAKTYPQANEDGTQKFEDDGVTPVMGPRETQFKAKKAAKEKAPRAPKIGAVELYVNDEPVILSNIQNEAHIQVVGNIGSKEGSKRAARAAAFSGVGTVAEFYGQGGLTKDLLRHLKTGAVKLEIPGRGTVTVKEKGKPVVQDAAAQTPDTDGILSPDVPANALDGGASDANHSTH